MVLAADFRSLRILHPNGRVYETKRDMGPRRVLGVLSLCSTPDIIENPNLDFQALVSSPHRAGLCGNATALSPIHGEKGPDPPHPPDTQRAPIPLDGGGVVVFFLCSVQMCSCFVRVDLCSTKQPPKRHQDGVQCKKKRNTHIHIQVEPKTISKGTLVSPVFLWRSLNTAVLSVRTFPCPCSGLQGLSFFSLR